MKSHIFILNCTSLYCIYHIIRTKFLEQVPALLYRYFYKDIRVDAYFTSIFPSGDIPLHFSYHKLSDISCRVPAVLGERGRGEGSMGRARGEAGQGKECWVLRRGGKSDAVLLTPQPSTTPSPVFQHHASLTSAPYLKHSTQYLILVPHPKISSQAPHPRTSPQSLIPEVHPSASLTSLLFPATLIHPERKY